MEDLTAKQKFFLYNSLYQDTFKEFSHDFHTTDLLKYQYNNFPIKKEDIQLEDVYILISTIKDFDPSGRHISNLHQFVTNNIFTALYITLFYVVSINKLHIKICGNCNRYFLTSKKNVTYCDRIAEDALTCKNIGSIEQQKRKLESKPVYKKHRRIQQIKCVYAGRYKDKPFYKNDYETFNKIANQFKDNIKKEKATEEEFDKWLDTQDKTRQD